jgi:hypothetical protein
MTMLRNHQCALVAILAMGLGVAGSACGSPTQPSSAPSALNVTGTWIGSASDSSGPGQMIWRLIQTDTSFSGTLTMSDASTNVSDRGSVSGSVSGSSIRFSISVQAGGFDSPYASCSTNVSGDAQASSSSITGTYSGTHSCTGAIASGQFTLTRSG